MSRARLHNLDNDLHEKQSNEEETTPCYSFSCAEMKKLGLEYRDYVFLNDLRNLVCTSSVNCPALKAVSSDIIEGLEAVVSNLECFDAGLNFLLRCINQLSDLT